MLLLVPLALAAPAPEEQAAFTGAWRLTEARESVQARVDAAIERTLAPFNAVIRGIARVPLHSIAFFCDHYDTRLTATTFLVGCDARPDITGTLGTSGVAGVSAEGSAYTLDAAWSAGRVTFQFNGDGGWQRVHYRAAGGGLQVEKTVHSNRLDADVTWAMTYARE